MKRLRSTPEVLVRLATPIENKDMNRKSNRDLKSGKPTYVMASHCFITCICSEPCITLYEVPRFEGRKVPRITIPMMIRIMVHESIHHAIAWQVTEIDDTLDNLFGEASEQIF